MDRTLSVFSSTGRPGQLLPLGNRKQSRFGQELELAAVKGVTANASRTRWYWGWAVAAEVRRICAGVVGILRKRCRQREKTG